jgi:hypothetical protein
MTNETVDQEQSQRIRDLEARVNQIENDVSAILAKLATVENLAKGLMVLAGAALGVDIIPMLGAGA